MGKAVYLIFASLLCVGTAMAAFSASYQDMDAFWSSYLTQGNLTSYGIPSTSIAVVLRNGTVVYQRAFGWQNKQTNTPATVNTIYRLASVSKTFAATVAMQLIEQGRVGLYTDLNEYFAMLSPPVHYKDYLVGNYSSYAGLPQLPISGNLTMWNVLTQTLGLDSSANMGTCETYQTCVPLPEYYSTSMPARIRPPGSLITYSNHGIGMIGLVAEAVLKPLTWSQILQQNVLDPLNLSNTSPSLTAALLTNPNRQIYQVAVNGEIYQNENPLNDFELYPAGAMWSTSGDMARFAAMHLNNGTYAPTGATIISPETAANMHREHFTSAPGMPGLGYVWFQGNLNNVSYIEHDGNLPGFNNRLRLYLEDGVAVVVLSNSGTTGFAYLATLVDRFQNAFMKPFDCVASGGGLSTIGCLAPAAWLPNAIIRPNAAAYYAATGLSGVRTVGYRYTHNTWQKLGGYVAGVHTLSVVGNYLSYLDEGQCFVELPGNLFYQGFLGPNGECYVSVPYSDSWLHSPRMDASGNLQYLLGQSVADEVITPAFGLNWIPLLVVYIVLFVLYFIVVLPALLCCLCTERCRRPSEKSTQFTELSASLSGSTAATSTEEAPEDSPRWVTVGALLSQGLVSLCYLINVIGALLMLSKQIYVGQYAPVRAVMAAAVPGVIFSVAQIAFTVMVKTMTRWRLALTLPLIFYVLVNVSFIAISLQWNWFGTSWVLGS